MTPKTKREEVLLDVIKELVKERDKWEGRYKHPLPKGWKYPDECSHMVNFNDFPDFFTKT